MQKKVEIFGLREEEDKGVVLITPWSACHLLSGMAMKNFGISTVAAFTIHGVYEVKDFYAREMGIEYNSSVADQGVAMIGHFLAKENSNLPYLWMLGVSFIFLTVTGLG
jgi:hypothetical protein